MGLVFDQRQELGSQPGCHAFIVGISAYPHLLGGPGVTATLNLGLTQLLSAAVSAHAIGDWLKQAKLAQPLATIRLLLSSHEAVEPGVEKATLEHFLRDASAWRDDAGRHEENMTFFYFAGQGFSLSQGEHVLALQDYGDGIGPALRNTVKVNNIVDGMSPTLNAGIGRTQLFSSTPTGGGRRSCRPTRRCCRPPSSTARRSAWTIARRRCSTPRRRIRTPTPI